MFDLVRVRGGGPKGGRKHLLSTTQRIPESFLLRKKKGGGKRDKMGANLQRIELVQGVSRQRGRRRSDLKGQREKTGKGGNLERREAWSHFPLKERNYSKKPDGRMKPFAYSGLGERGKVELRGRGPFR